jgi:hypothetical protein
LKRCCRAAVAVLIGWTTGALSVGSFTCCVRALAGAIARQNMGATQRSTIVSSAGATRPSGCTGSTGDWHSRNRWLISHVKAHRCAAGGKRGAFEEAIGRSWGGRTTTIHALSDAEGKPSRPADSARQRTCTPERCRTHKATHCRQGLRYQSPARLAQRAGIKAVIPSSARRKPLIFRTIATSTDSAI